jgi:hypothetical protein
MRFIVRKYIDADNAKEALDKEPSVPVHDIYLKDGEEPPRKEVTAIGFRLLEPNPETYEMKEKR